eukprot:3572820-Pyramimonas_sp.AAC.1
MTTQGAQPQTQPAAPEQSATPPSPARPTGDGEADNGASRDTNISQIPPRATPANPATPREGP